MQDLVIRGGRPWGAPTADIAVRDGRIAAIGADLPALPGEEIVDARGCLVIPGLVDAHAHIDKTLWGTPWHPHQAGPSLMDKIENERRVLDSLGLSPEVQSARLLRRLIACGTSHVRTHVDVGPDVGLAHLHGVQAMRDRHRGWIDIDMVAFPQTGVMIRPGTLDLLEQAVRDGAEVIGGLDPVGVDRDPKGQLDGIFAIAGRHGCGVDIHLHDRGDLGAVTIEMIAERTRSLGLTGKVAISHAFCLGGVEPARLESLIALLLDNDIAIMTHAPAGPTPFPPIRLLHERGVRLFSGSDGVRDTWSPLNNGDMLERAFLLAYRSGFRDDPGIELA
ncbi:MAG: amidohydrolase, partial [Polaromonas sp.]